MTAELLKLREGILRRRPAAGESPHQERAGDAAGIEPRPGRQQCRRLVLLGRVQTLDEVEQIIDSLTVEAINAYLADNPPASSVSSRSARSA
jgi:hypothetical protein